MKNLRGKPKGEPEGTLNVLGHVSEKGPRIGAAAVTPPGPRLTPPGHCFGVSRGLSGFPFRLTPCHTFRKTLSCLTSQQIKYLLC